MRIFGKRISIFLLIAYHAAFGQTQQFDYQREISGVDSIWHTIALPQHVLSKIALDFADLRVFGGADGAIELPYVLKKSAPQLQEKEVPFQLINRSFSDSLYYFTLVTIEKNRINRIDLNFDQNNFDWKVTLQGSQNQEEWYTVVKDYRIVSIQNAHSRFSFATLHFPTSEFLYYRLIVPSSLAPTLLQAAMIFSTEVPGELLKAPVSRWDTQIKTSTKTTEIGIALTHPTFVNQLSLPILDEFDYFRPITIQYVADSTQVSGEWLYHYRNLYSGTLHSLSAPIFDFTPIRAQHFKVIIQNFDNQPLHCDTPSFWGYKYELHTRFHEGGPYFLRYGNADVQQPNYDIVQFPENIPPSLSPVSLGPELFIGNKAVPAKKPLFAHPIWLLGVIGLVIGLLIWFAFSMLNSAKDLPR
ncbi:MAG: hypothetical protein LAT76_06620 [Schleiferiaceae bacterium]|nr:hypothetical protein [Schleiferiaceae bacterium]